ncbi:type I-G CRISPR-associated protein Cas8g1/Csx17 [Desulfovibrio piger]|uniref:type I-G CRISPR-associated protein Cas8g1/Csx17 n=1 Tax=Desulfovibrio piger TaxID=901 RepID=UPI0026EB2387|nr:type I-U CRISPR-associated protein Csx17 [Desulfovibrio piger]
MPDILLEGCASRPLAAYLKALGILRLVGEQADANARGAWQNGAFLLSSSLDRQALCDFFMETWQPTPLVTPWNGGSGFYPGDNREGIDALAQSTSPRLAVYREVIVRIRNWPELVAPPKEKKQLDELRKRCKETFLQRCRAELPESCLPWLDATCILRTDKAVFAPLLGTGGNEGRLEYSSNFMRHVAKIFACPPEESRAWLESALFGLPVNGLPKSAAGQFDPGHAGGCNQDTGPYRADVPVNPWDFLLLFEGTLLFAGSLTRRAPEDPNDVCFPFCVEGLAAGFASSSLTDKGRGEIWMPLWSRTASLREVRRLLGEGRASLGRRQARNGLDFARAIASLGVERGIDGFERYSFLERRGQSYVALPSGSLSVQYQPQVALLDPVARWVQQRCRQKEEPNSLTAARRRLAAAVFACTRTPDAPRFVAVSRTLAQMDALPGLPGLLAAPCTPLSPDWISACDDGGPEARLAAALASLRGSGKLGPFRAHLSPVAPHALYRWEDTSDHHVPWRGETLEGLGRMFLRRLVLAQRYGEDPLRADLHLSPTDLLPLLDGRLDVELLRDLLRAFSLVGRPQRLPEAWCVPLRQARLPHAVALLKLLYTPLPQDAGLDRERLRPEQRILRLVQAGRLAEACALAAQRLRIAGGGGLYLPTSFAESVRALSPAAVLACLAVPVDGRALLHQLRQPS